MGRFTLLAMALIVCCRIALADPVARAAFLRDFPLRSDRMATFRPGVDAEPILAPATSAAGLRTLKQSERGLAAGRMELGEPGSVVGEIGPGLFDDNGELVFGGGAQEALGPTKFSSDKPMGTAFDWPDLSGVVELLVAQSSQELMAKYRLPGQHGPRKKKKKTKEELMAQAQCRHERSPRSLFSQSFHILAATFIGTFLVIVVLRKSGKGSYWW